jgi:hypothetical protein
MIFDTEKNVVFTDAQIAKFAELQIAGEETTLTKDDWKTAVQARSDEIYADRGMTKETRFSKAIGGMSRTERGTAFDTGDELAKLCHEAYKAAPPVAPPPPEPPVDIAKAEAARRGSASVQMLNLAREHQKTFPSKSDAAAYTAVYTDPRNVELKSKVLAENWSLAGLGDTRYMAEQNRPYSNPHTPHASTPRAGCGSRP